MRSSPGFTLMEVMVVTVIIGILAMVAVPGFQSQLVNARVGGATRQLYTTMNFARLRAISDNNIYVITFDTANHSYSVYDDNDNDFNPASPDPAELVKTVSINHSYKDIEFGYIAGKSPSGNTINGAVRFGSTNPPRLIFRPTGLVKTFGTAYLKPSMDTVRKDRQRAVSVNFIGRIKIYRHTGKGNKWEG